MNKHKTSERASIALNSSVQETDRCEISCPMLAISFVPDLHFGFDFFINSGFAISIFLAWVPIQTIMTQFFNFVTKMLITSSAYLCRLSDSSSIIYIHQYIASSRSFFVTLLNNHVRNQNSW